MIVSLIFMFLDYFPIYIQSIFLVLTMNKNDDMTELVFCLFLLHT